jgi:DNA-binding NarL/FixJ family response regulator
MQQKIRILVADDHAVVRQGLGRILAAEPDMEIVAEAGNGREVLERAQEMKADIVIMDVAMPELNGIEATRALLVASPHIRVLAVSMHKEAVYVREMLRAGARGYLIKDAQETDLVEAVRAVWQGQGYISPAIAESVLVDYRKHVDAPVERLTVREREVLRLIAEGKTNKEIAAMLTLSVYTVDAHRGNIMEKLNLRSAAEIVRFAMRNGLIE